MSSALTYSLAGMQAASDRLAIRARNVANVQTPGYRAADVVQEATGSGPVVSVRPPVEEAAPIEDVVEGASLATQTLERSPHQYSLQLGDLAVAPSDVSLEYELTDMILAKHAYKASAIVTRTAGELQDSLLDIFI